MVSDAKGDESHRGPEGPAAHVSDYLALLPSGPDAVRRLKLHRVRAAVRPVITRVEIVAQGNGPALRSSV